MLRSRGWFAVVLLAAVAGWAGAASAASRKGDVLLLAWSMNGELALVRETFRGQSATTVSYRVVGPGVLQKHHEISRRVTGDDGSEVEQISAEACRASLIELRDLLRAKRFKGVLLLGDACKASDRGTAIEVAPEQASEADASELEPTAGGDALVHRDWKVRVEASALVLEGPDKAKRLRLPRPITPAAAHVLISPTRRLLLLLESTESGDQILAAGFSSKTGTIGDFQ